MAAKKSRKSLEHTLWDAVDKSRGNQEPSGSLKNSWRSSSTGTPEL